ncbi:hypothetical protein INR49_026214 [Caranx melampygus]|nr:hypothetical protein INR49_026214 [Caranx melampygus]
MSQTVDGCPEDKKCTQTEIHTCLSVHCRVHHVQISRLACRGTQDEQEAGPECQLLPVHPGGRALPDHRGSIHYFRVPRAYWRDRLLKMKACGINTLTTAYINLAAELGLWVILCPGPYISAELDLGGLPSWLLRDGSMRLRTTYSGFTQAVNTFFDKLIPKLVPQQFKKGGPIIAVQVENNYGAFAKDESYMLFIKDVISLKLQKLNQRDIQDLNALQPNGPVMVMDYWTGWYDVWGDLHHVLPPEDAVSTMREMLRRGFSVNLYMFHGGSSFGFMSGALADPSYKALPFKSPKPVNMENLPVNNGNGQSYGYTLYETTITSGGFLSSGDNVRDRALVFVDRSYIGLFKRQSLELAVPDGKSWEKGVVFINGMNLGRYWSIGPQQTLYLPGPFLNSGINQLQTVCVVIICKVDNPRLAVIDAEGLPEPPKGQVPLYGTTWYPGVSSVPMCLVVPWCLHVEVGVVESCLQEETADKGGSPLRVLHQDPVEVRHMEQGVGQTRQLCFLHWPAVGGSDDMDSGQEV